MKRATVEIDPGVQTIVWDLDGTLLDSFGIFRDCLRKVFHNHGLPEPSELILRNNHHGLFEDSVAGILRDLGQAVTKSMLAVMIRDFYALDNVYIEDIDHHLFEDAVDLAGRAHKAGMRQIMVTNRLHGTDRGNGSPRNLVRHSRLHAFIDDVLCGDDSVYRKPDRRFLEARFGSDLTKLGKTVVIGDQFVDAELAQNLGSTAVLVTRAGIIAHLDQLAGWEEYTLIVPSLFDVQIPRVKSQ